MVKFVGYSVSIFRGIIDTVGKPPADRKTRRCPRRERTHVSDDDIVRRENERRNEHMGPEHKRWISLQKLRGSRTPPVAHRDGVALVLPPPIGSRCGKMAPGTLISLVSILDTARAKVTSCASISGPVFSVALSADNKAIAVLLRMPVVNNAAMGSLASNRAGSPQLQ